MSEPQNRPTDALLPEGYEKWTPAEMIDWLARTLDATTIRLSLSLKRERILKSGLDAIAYEMDFCRACGNPEGSVCANPNRCNFGPGDPQKIAVDTISKALAHGQVNH